MYRNDEFMLDRTQIQDLLPHQGHMFLLDGVLSYDGDQIACRSLSHRDLHNPLRTADKLPVHAGIEYAAQAAGIHGGLLNRVTDPQAAPQLGYLAVLSNIEWQVERLDDLPDELHIHARRTAVTPGGRLYRFRIEHRADTVMHGELIIALELR